MYIGGYGKPDFSRIENPFIEDSDSDSDKEQPVRRPPVTSANSLSHVFTAAALQSSRQPTQAQNRPVIPIRLNGWEDTARIIDNLVEGWGYTLPENTQRCIIKGKLAVTITIKEGCSLVRIDLPHSYCSVKIGKNCHQILIPFKPENTQITFGTGCTQIMVENKDITKRT